MLAGRATAQAERMPARLRSQPWCPEVRVRSIDGYCGSGWSARPGAGQLARSACAQAAPGWPCSCVSLASQSAQAHPPGLPRHACRDLAARSTEEQTPSRVPGLPAILRPAAAAAAQRWPPPSRCRDPLPPAPPGHSGSPPAALPAPCAPGCGGDGAVGRSRRASSRRVSARRRQTTCPQGGRRC